MTIKVGDMVIVKRETLLNCELVEREAPEKARVMAIADDYAMVRFKRCTPFTLYMKDIERWNNSAATPHMEGKEP